MNRLTPLLVWVGAQGCDDYRSRSGSLDFGSSPREGVVHHSEWCLRDICGY